MSIRDYKITDAQFSEKGVIAAPDTLTGTAAENKGVFDRFAREIEEEARERRRAQQHDDDDGVS